MNILINIIIVVIVITIFSWLVTFVRATLGYKKVKASKDTVFDKLKNTLEEKNIQILKTRKDKGEITVYGLYNIINVFLYQLIGERIVFKLSGNEEETEVKVFARSKLWSIRLGISKKEKNYIIDENKVQEILNGIL